MVKVAKLNALPSSSGRSRHITIIASGTNRSYQGIGSDGRTHALGRNMVKLISANIRTEPHLVNYGSSSTRKKRVKTQDPSQLNLPVVMYMDHRKERIEMLKELLEKKVETNPLHVLNQETLIIWGDQDNVFPLYMGYQLKRHLGEKSRLEIIKDAGHASQMESPSLVNDLIKSFICDSWQ